MMTSKPFKSYFFDFSNTYKIPINSGTIPVVLYPSSDAVHNKKGGTIVFLLMHYVVFCPFFAGPFCHVGVIFLNLQLDCSFWQLISFPA
jgi:hypothetical protein